MSEHGTERLGGRSTSQRCYRTQGYGTNRRRNQRQEQYHSTRTVYAIEAVSAGEWYKELKKGTLNNIVKKAGIALAELKDLV